MDRIETTSAVPIRQTIMNKDTFSTMCTTKLYTFGMSDTDVSVAYLLPILSADVDIQPKQAKKRGLKGRASFKYLSKRAEKQGPKGRITL